MAILPRGGAELRTIISNAAQTVPTTGLLMESQGAARAVPNVEYKDEQLPGAAGRHVQPTAVPSVDYKDERLPGAAGRHVKPTAVPSGE